jgi:hypothetical protein
MSSSIGQRGEALFVRMFLKPRNKPRFKVTFLGDTWPVIDFYVELRGLPGRTPFFFAQVKTTARGYTTRDRRLLVRVDETSIRRLAGHPAPTYIVGVDDVQERGYVVSANGEHATSLSSMTTEHPVNEATRQALWEEVRAFWAAREQHENVSMFTDSKWR